jgi:hypothetical protein
MGSSASFRRGAILARPQGMLSASQADRPKLVHGSILGCLAGRSVHSIISRDTMLLGPLWRDMWLFNAGPADRELKGRPRSVRIVKKDLVTQKSGVVEGAPYTHSLAMYSPEGRMIECWTYQPNGGVSYRQLHEPSILSQILKNVTRFSGFTKPWFAGRLHRLTGQVEYRLGRAKPVAEMAKRHHCW